MSELQALSGFRDFYPEEFAARAYIFRVWRDVARRYGFEEYDGPPLEPLELYTRKSGPEIVEQLYEFTDKGDRRVALRPEMTPTLARMVGARARGLRKPIRWFSIPQLFRYERQQRGRLREHFQLNMDILGDTDVMADAELLAAALDIMRQLGLDADRVRARVSDRRLLAAIFEHIGVPEERLLDVYHVVDRMDRESRGDLAERLQAIGLDDERIDEIFRVTEVKGIERLRSEFAAADGVAERVAELSAYLEHLSDLGVDGFVDIDLSVVRGLAYYTGIVFELWDARRELRAICGGGRYDDLLGTLSGIDMPAIGFGMGDVVLAELLRDYDLLPALERSIDCYVVSIGEDARRWAVRAARRLRDAGLSAAYDFRDRRVSSQFKSADSLGARVALVIGPQEIEAGVAKVRDMSTGEEQVVEFERVVDEIESTGAR